MASVAFDQFLPEILLEVPSVPEPVAINAVRNACFDFCRDSLWLSRYADPETYTDGVATYELSADGGEQIVAVMHITIDGVKTVYPWALEDVVSAKPNWSTATGTIDGYVQPSPDVVSFVAVPNTSGTFVANLAVAPARTATAVDARIFNLHLETIKYGALWKLKSQAGQPWSDAAGASLNEQRFLMMVNQAVIERTRGNTRAALRVAPRPFV